MTSRRSDDTCLKQIEFAAANDKIKLADVKIADQATIKRGEYVMRVGDCAACHTAESGNFAGNYQFVTPFGTLLSSNITPDTKTGIGNMTEREFFNAVRHGRGSHGLLYPAMPYTAYVKFTDRDMHDLWAYMSTVKAVDTAAGRQTVAPDTFAPSLVGNLEASEKVHSNLFSLLLRHFPHPDRCQRAVFEDRQMREQIKVQDHHADFAAHFAKVLNGRAR